MYIYAGLVEIKQNNQNMYQLSWNFHINKT